MADDYEKNRAFGKPENIEKRLAMWARQFSMDKSYPWVGLGLIDDLKCACRMLGGDPDKRYTDMRNPKAGPVEGPVSTHGKPEYDL
jgi:hypothetical protein